MVAPVTGLFQDAWGFVASSASLSTLIGCAAMAVAILEPKFLDAITDLRKWAIVVAAAAFSYTAIAGKFYHDGLAVKQAEWDAAVKGEVAAGEKAHDNAVTSVGPLSADRRLFRDDPNNRDRGKN